MARILTIVLSFLFLLTTISNAQRLERFSEDHAEFIRQLEEYMTSSKREVLEEAYKEFADVFASGQFTEEEVQQILKTGNAMLEQRMTAGPYFQNYLRALTKVKNTKDPARVFQEWHSVMDQMLAGIENRRLRPFDDFLEFSTHFFERRALRYSDSGGTSWYAYTDDFTFKFKNDQPMIDFEGLDLMAQRRTDSIFIYQTSGTFEPVERMWRGTGGRVTWERHGLPKGVFAELGAYEFEAIKSLYSVEDAKMHYPVYFGNKAVTGTFSDKLVSSSDAVEGSFPRFESTERLEVSNIGEGIAFEGYFRLHGTTVYGFGNKQQPATINIRDANSTASFRGASELFTIRREDRIAGSGVEGVLYFGNDSIYHPSVDVRFEIKEREMTLSRGESAADQNPFYSSLHGINFYANTMTAYLNGDSIAIGRGKLPYQRKEDVVFESLNYFTEQDYRQLQSIASVNPIAILKVMYDNNGGVKTLPAADVAQRLNPKFGIENIKSLLYDMVARGFINYYPEEEIVEVKDKVFLYADAYRDLIDYDVLRIRSTTDSTNAVMNLANNSIDVRGVDMVELSAKQRVALKPEGDHLVVQDNRNIDFDGVLFAGLTTLEGKDFHFKYEPFQIDLDSVRFFDLFVPTGKLMKSGEPEALSIGSRLEHLTGVLLIDAPSNKSGKEDIPMFPSLQSKDYSYVFYDYPSAQKRAYTRDSFYFEVNPFSFNHLDFYTREDVQFEGTLYPAGIFPPFEETVSLQEDESLGFIHETEGEGYTAYQERGLYTGELALSNSGLLGKGNLTYLGASIDSEDMIWMPKQMLASAEEFNLEESREEGLEVPQVRGIDVKIDWRPYQDSMYIRSEEEAFKLFPEEVHTLDGTLILTPGGLKGDGTFDWETATMVSNLFSFGAFSSTADTTAVKIKTQDLDDIALETTNVQSDVDFEEQLATFKANQAFLETKLPAIQYKTSINEFTWDMADESITFKAEEGSPGKFTSIHPGKDSLNFEGGEAFYDLKTDELSVSGVPFLIAADAFVYPDSNFVKIGEDGEMATLENARIVADTLNQNHVIKRATVDVKGRRFYQASGFYEYNVGDREQEIEFENIVGQPLGKGPYDERPVVTVGKGEVTEEDEFYIDQRTEFQGEIGLRAETKNLSFDGFARLDAERLPYRYWFTVQSEADKNDLAISFDEPKNLEGEPLATGFFLSKETAEIYPRVMMPLFFRKDRQILPVKGIFKYNRDKDYFIFGDSVRIQTNGIRGNQLTFWNGSGKLEGKGKFNLGTGLNYVSIDASGVMESRYEEVVNPDEMIISDTMSLIPSIGQQEEGVQRYEIDAEFMSGVQLIVPDKLLKIMMNDIESMSFDAKPIVYLTELDFYREALMNLLPEGTEAREALATLGNGILDIPKKVNPYTFLFSKIPMKWDAEYQSFVSKEDKIGVVSVAGEPLNKMLEAYVEYKMPSNEDDRLYLYIKSPSELFYFFGFKQGIMSITSNNPEFMDALGAMKSKELITKMDDGNTYEIQAVDVGSARLFLNRVKAAQQK
ncbi:MAG: hypothetical protein NXI25_01945 [bacterium]|nr:hypothetical protein [bacterium]